MAHLDALRVRHSVDSKDRPLAVVFNLPDLNVGMTPQELRALAAALQAAASEAEALVVETRCCGPVRREYRITAA